MFEQSSYFLTEGNTVQVCALLSSESMSDILFTAGLIISGGTAIQNSDFVISGQTLTFLVSETRSCVNVQAIDDTTLEGDEVFTLLLESSDEAVQISPTADVTTITIPNQNSE